MQSDFPYMVKISSHLEIELSSKNGGCLDLIISGRTKKRPGAPESARDYIIAPGSAREANIGARDHRFF